MVKTGNCKGVYNCLITIMAFVCAISNEVPETPVVSPASGSEHGPKDPINGERLELTQLIEVKPASFVKSKAPTHTSIPAILKSLQDEWDASMLHSFTMKQQLQTARQELSHCLYQHDAACRVVARLSKELVGAREVLANLKPQQQSKQMTMTTNGVNKDGDESVSMLVSTVNEVLGISPEIKAKLHETATALTQERKAKAKIIPPSLTSVQDLMNYAMVASLTGLHSASSPGIMCLDVQNDWIVTGGNDKVVSIYDQTSKSIVTSLKGHTKKVMNVACLNKQLVDGHHRESMACPHLPMCSDDLCSRKRYYGIELPPTGIIFCSLSLMSTGLFGAIYARKRGGANEDGKQGSPLTSARFHPDGLIFATGTFGTDVKIWDLKGQDNVATFTGHAGPVVSIAFSENGYYLATAADDASVKLWDLRKLKNFKTIQMEPEFKITDVAFDYSGSYLALAGSDVRVYACKSWKELAIFSEHTATATEFGSGTTLGGLLQRVWIAVARYIQPTHYKTLTFVNFPVFSDIDLIDRYNGPHKVPNTKEHYECLLCFDTYSETKNKSSDSFPFLHELFPGAVHCQTLEKQLKQVFILRHLLDIPSSWCEEILKGGQYRREEYEFDETNNESYHPDSWFWVCTSCLTQTVIKALKIHHQILCLEGEMRQLKDKLKVTMRQRWDNERRNGRIDDAIREMVCSEVHENESGDNWCSNNLETEVVSGSKDYERSTKKGST
ncbi:Pre-mRNA-processing factor 19 [Orchesella cincta]|uniref:Pre-mRNA-processing factor 19 n=1 Tax=Orchesella cincta TaxID=48709 RepID=A0A1D2MA49_ORCCI|nr:Pre-mRNA-processing factor 19 [Orchesella cincta]